MNPIQSIKKMIIYLPAFNEADTIEQVLKSLPRVLSGVEQIEILVVDDGSTDDTARIAQREDTIVISHHRNRGLGIAFQTAVNFAVNDNTDILVSIDADGQFNPEDIPGLIAPIQDWQYSYGYCQ